MGKNTKIEWCHHTQNFWIGCTKVSPGCANCYAERQWDTKESLSKRSPLWGPSGVRILTSIENCNKPLAWDKEAKDAGERRRVFCSSLSDFFEARADLFDYRKDAFKIIEKCKNLDWLLLTKRPENVNPMISAIYGDVDTFFAENKNIWIGTSVENQIIAEKRIGHLIKIPAQTRFLSVEPLLGPLDLYDIYLKGVRTQVLDKINWIIVGAESGPKARPMDENWVRTLRDQAVKNNIPFMYKQMVVNGEKFSLPELDGTVWNQFPR